MVLSVQSFLRPNTHVKFKSSHAHANNELFVCCEEQGIRWSARDWKCGSMEHSSVSSLYLSGLGHPFNVLSFSTSMISTDYCFHLICIDFWDILRHGWSPEFTSNAWPQGLIRLTFHLHLDADDLLRNVDSFVTEIQNSQSQDCLSLKNDPVFWWEHSWEFLWTDIDDAWFLHRARILPSFGNIDMEIFSQETVCCDGILNIPAILRDMWDAIVGVSSER